MTGIVDLGGLTKPATVLIERISDAVGGLAKPWQIERVAHAEAKASIIKAKADIEISEIEKRAIRRLVSEEGKNQENIEAISTGAIPLLTETAEPEKIDEDWLVRFFEKSRRTSDNDVQLIWSKILAGEANSAGSFSKRAIDVVASMEKRDGELFQRLCAQTVQFHAYQSDKIVEEYGHLAPIIFGKGNSYFGDFRLNDLFELQDLGLIRVDQDSILAFCTPSVPIPFKYGSLFGDIKHAPHFLDRIPTGNVVLTRTGIELFKIVDPSEREGFISDAIEWWSSMGCSASLRP